MGRFPKSVATVSGDSGGAIAPNQTTGNLSLKGESGISISGSGSTLTISGGGAGTLSTLTGNTGGAISPTASNINIQGAGNIAVSGAGSTLTITDTTGSIFLWNDGATTTTMSANNGYIVTAGSQILTLPPTASIGDAIEILLNGGVSWEIAQTAGQSILINSITTTIGALGSVSSSGPGQSIKLTCVIANTKWLATSLTGNPTMI